MLATYMILTLYLLNEMYAFNINVYIIARNEKKCKSIFKNLINNDNFHFIYQDINKHINLEEKVDYIIHAASSANPFSIKNNPIDICFANTLGTINVLEWAKNRSVKNILFTSTREVYGENKQRDISLLSEKDFGSFDTLDNRSCYPESKRMAETLFKSYNLQFNVPFVIARIAHSYGPYMNINNDGRVLSDFISDAVNSKNIVLKSDGSALRSFCYITDAVSALFLILLKGGCGQAYNVSNETEEISLKKLAELIISINDNPKINVEYKIENSTVYCAYKRIGLNTKKIEDLGWRPEIDLNLGLSKTLLFFKS